MFFRYYRVAHILLQALVIVPLLIVISCSQGVGLNDVAKGDWLFGPCERFGGLYSETSLLGEGRADDPYFICLPEQMSLIGDTDTNPEYRLDKHYRLDKNVRFGDNATVRVGTCATPFTGSFNGNGYEVSNIGFTSEAKDIFVTNLFPCADPEILQDPRLTYVPEEEVCGQINTNELRTRQDGLDGSFILCSIDHLRAINASSDNLMADYVLYRDIRFEDGATVVIGNGTCGDDTAFQGNFDGHGHTISNVGFTPDIGSPPERIYVDELFSCSDNVRNVNFSRLPGDQVCQQVNNNLLMAREGSSDGPFIVCSIDHLRAINADLMADYALYQDIRFEPIT